MSISAIASTGAAVTTSASTATTGHPRRHRPRRPPRRRRRRRRHPRNRRVGAGDRAAAQPRPSSARSPSPSTASPPRRSPIPTAPRRCRPRRVNRGISPDRPTTRKARFRPTARRRPALARCLSKSDRNARGFVEPLAAAIDIISVGDFSAQCLNGRRQAIIFRLRGVAFFRRHSCQIRLNSRTRASPAETAQMARPSGCRWRLSAALAPGSPRLAQAASIAAPGADVQIADSWWSP